MGKKNENDGLIALVIGVVGLCMIIPFTIRLLKKGA